MGTLTFRFANVIKQSNVGTEELWKIVREVKIETFNDFSCSGVSHSIILKSTINSLVNTIQQRLHMTTWHIWDLGNDDLKTAAEMYIYLTICPGTLKPWFVFFKDIFEVHSPQNILLTLNRIMKTNKNQMTEYIKNFSPKIITKSLFERFTILLRNQSGLNNSSMQNKTSKKKLV